MAVKLYNLYLLFNLYKLYLIILILSNQNGATISGGTVLMVTLLFESLNTKRRENLQNQQLGQKGFN